MAPHFKRGPGPKPETDLDRAIRAQVEKDEVDIKIRRVDNKNKALSLIDDFRDRIERKFTRWTICALNFADAYQRAAKNHKDALAKAEKYNALDAQKMFSALTLLMSGPISMIWNSRMFDKAGDLIKTNLKDVAVTFPGELLSALGPAVAALPPAKDNTAADDALDELYGEPLNALITMQRRVLTWKDWALGLITLLRTEIRNMSVLDWDLWDEKATQARIDAFWTGDGISPGADDIWGMDPNKSEQDIKDMAYDLERSMWAKWMPRLRTAPGFRLPVVSFLDPSCRDANWTYEDVKSPIEARFKGREEGGLNIFREANMDGIHWLTPRRLEAEKLINWAGWFQAHHPVWNK